MDKLVLGCEVAKDDDTLSFLSRMLLLLAIVSLNSVSVAVTICFDVAVVCSRVLDVCKGDC